MNSKSLPRTRTPAWKYHFWRFCHQYRTQIHLALGGTIAYTLNLPTPAQAQSCVGFMCAAKQGLLADGVISTSEFMKTAINFMFIAGNAFLAFVFLLGFIFVIIKVIERENYITPGVIFLVAIFGIVIVNWATGYLFGNTNAGATTEGSGAVPAGTIDGGAGQFQ